MKISEDLISTKPLFPYSAAQKGTLEMYSERYMHSKIV